MRNELRQTLQPLQGALAALGGDVAQAQVEVVEEIGSTNTALLEHARATGDVRPRLLMAWRQTQGRGRSGRPWVGDAGASLTWSWGQVLQAGDASGLSLAVGAALAEALDPIHEAQTPRLLLKWPNDLWLQDPQAPCGGRKLGGVLIESTSVQGARWCVVGVGLNVRPLPAPATQDFTTGMAALQELDPAWEPPGALMRAAPAVAGALAAFERQGFAAFASAYARRDLLYGRPVVTTGAEGLQGTACGVAANGALQLRTPEGQLRSVVSGEVSVRPAA